MKRIYTFLFFNLLLLISLSAQNNALDFDGANDCVIANELHLSGSSHTLEAWIYPRSFNTGDWGGNISQIVYGGNENILIRLGDHGIDGNQVQFVISTGEDHRRLTSNIRLTANNWYHIAGVYNGTTMYLYINGILDNQLTPPVVGDIATTTAAFGIGGNTGGDRMFEGKIDEVRIWSTARSKSEIIESMYTELSGNEGGMVSYYKFNETSGTIAGNSEGTSSYDGTLTNMDNSDWITSSAIFGPKNCLEFDGIDDYVTTGDALVNFAYDLTIEAWFNTTNSNSFNSIATMEHNDPNGLGNFFQLLTNSAGNIYLDDANDAPILTTTESYNDGKWHHVTFVRNASAKTIHLYVDGVLKETETYNSSGNIHADHELRFGNSEYQGGSYQMDGKLDEIRIWDDIRTVTEIRENMFKSLTGNEDNLSAYFNVDNTSGSMVQDLSGNGHDGTLTNMSDADWVSSAAYNTWLNTSSTTPSTSTNWSLGSVPTDSDNVGIYNWGSSFPSVGSSFDCNHFFLENGANYTLNDGASFIAQGNEFINGSFTLNKTLTNDSKWHLISPPNNNTTANDFFGDYLQNWNESSGLWEDISDENTPLTPVKAYGFFGIHAKANYAFTGTPNTGEQDITLTVTGTGEQYKKANAVGNPYPSAIDWDLVSGYGAKYTWNGVAYESYPEDIDDGYATGPRYVAPMQGFFVIPDESGTFTLTNEDRTHSGANGFEKSSKELKNGLVLFADNGNYQDKLVIVFNEESNDDFELEKDAWKILSNAEGLSQLYSFENDQKLSIDNRPEKEIIQLGFKNDENGNYSIGIQEKDGIAKAELEDTKLDQFHDITTMPYSFNWQITDSEERFILHLKATGLDDLEEQEVQVYAANGQLYINLTESQDFEKVIIYDLAGRKIDERNLRAQEINSFDMQHLNGVYLVQLLGTKKIIKKKIKL